MATTPRTSAAGHTLPGSKLRRVTEHIQAHLDHDLTLAQLGAVVYMSPYHFARLFQHSTSLPPHRFVVRERIDRAVTLLAAPALSIAHISRWWASVRRATSPRCSAESPASRRARIAPRTCAQACRIEGEVEMESHDLVMERRGQESALADVPLIRRRLTVDRDADLVERLCRNEPGATEALVAVYGDRVYRLAIGITGNRSDAEEVVQDALWATIRKIDTFRGTAAFGSWVYRISANAAYKKRRARRVERNEMSWDDLRPSFEETGAHLHSGSDWSPRLKDPVLQAELQSVLCAAIGQLPVDHRAIFLLHDVEGLSNREIAAALRVKVDTIKSRVHRARLFLRCRLAVYVGSGEAKPGAVGGSTSGAIHRPLPPLAARATPGRRPSPSTVSAP